MACRLGRDGLEANGDAVCLRDIEALIRVLTQASSADYVVLGGGNATLVDPLPEGTRRGGNEDAIAGGCRLWEEPIEPHDRAAALGVAGRAMNRRAKNGAAMHTPRSNLGEQS